MTWHDFGPHRVWAGDNLDALAALPDNSVDAVVTDPPYGLAFMGRRWDYDVPTETLWREALRVAKPGAHLLSFGGSRTFHRMAVRVEDAGWELRDTIMWLYGSGFPKSHNGPWGGTALKPAHEPIIMARKPLEGTVAANVARWGVGGINVDGCRVETGEALVRPPVSRTDNAVLGRGLGAGTQVEPAGRWPANVLHDGSDEVQLAFAAFGEGKPKPGRAGRKGGHTGGLAFGSGGDAVGVWPDDPGGTAARFFYAAKASRSERGGSMHPTVKPLALMRYLVRLVTPPGGTVLDPFTGSGTTMLAADAGGFRFIGAEREHMDDVAMRWGKR